MSNVPTSISYGKHTVRTININGVPKFCANDFCSVLGYKNTRNVVRRLDKNSREYIRLDTPGGPQTFVMINIDGIREILWHTRKRITPKMQKWINEHFFLQPATTDIVILCNGCKEKYK